MRSAISLCDEIHSRAVEVSTRYGRAEVELIEVLQQVEEHRVFLRRGHSSLFAYVTAELGMSENTAYALITVARKAREVPELKMQLQAGAMTFSNARRVVAVLTQENKSEWIERASQLSNRELEKEIVRFRPQEATVERASYVSPERVRLELGLSERDMLRLRRAQDLLSQSKRRSVSLEETLGEITREYLRRNDPLEKAKRNRVRKPSVPVKTLVTLRLQAGESSPKRTSVPAAVRHQVNLRDRGRCTFVLGNGLRCGQSRWLDIHHKIPVSRGGTNSIKNLITLCSAHHRHIHQNLDTAGLSRESG